VTGKFVTRKPVAGKPVTRKVSAREAYRLWARTYDDTPNPIVSLIDRHLEIPNGIVIDVACGTGRWVERTGGFGVDLSREMLSRCLGRVAQADARCLPFARGVADVALCILALGYIYPVEDALEELHRITRTGGTIIAADVHPQAIEAGWARSFRDGDDVYEIENNPYRPDGAVDLFFGEAERAIYDCAGRADLFERVRAIPAVWMKRWTR
jgi:SAM-dependent methyltransferase